MAIELLHTDCMTYMATLPDKAFELAIVDPPYGIGQDWKKRTKNRNKEFKDSSYKNKPVDKKYFDEVKRVSKDWIIWGWNYYTEILGSTNYLICWDKKSADNPVFYYSQFELAQTSKKIPANMISISWDGYRMGEETGIDKIHPHQKPIKLYRWLLHNYASPGDRILDTHGGSRSLAIACHQMGFDHVSCEIDLDYHNDSLKRYNNAIMQQSLFK